AGLDRHAATLRQAALRARPHTLCEVWCVHGRERTDRLRAGGVGHCGGTSMTTFTDFGTELPRLAAAMLVRVRREAPRIHCLMNTVVQKLVADGLSALGAIPSMTSSTEEMQHFARKVDALSV